ncbi:7-deoxyloganetin glucosyltransferase-like [Dendrobium catenatum]|uniref:Glycosyltransferase n=1 Tax=Dendrobium catenatum TaxID=906689 RepID=A0A2I0XA09_9ASPA|nr:7-deoxyloganetin glucosyltransferase-like [Dendrobium catenatum]PKU84724.1 UDP-glycosyltransferase 85A2 [Dendrobium catenatum]
MGSVAAEKHHAVCVPYPAQGHMNPVLKLAKVLHARGFYITFVLTEFNYRRLVRSQGAEAVRGLADFRFASIPDGLPYSDEDATQNVPDLCESTMKNCLGPFLGLLAKLNEENSSGAPPVSCIVSDGVMSFTLDAARDLGIPEILFWTTSACGFLAYLHYQQLVDRGLVPFKDEAELNNGRFLDTEVDWIPGLRKGTRLKDLPTFIRVTDPNEKMFNFILHEVGRVSMASALVLNTIDALEVPALAALQKILPSVNSIGPLSALVRRTIPSDSPLAAISTSLWKEDSTCLNWLAGKEAQSVVYVNFGSITIMSNEQLVEFAWGLANSGYAFLWVIRPDLVKGESAVLPPEFLEEIKERGMMTSWCAQEELLFDPAVGVFLTHSGWNSTLESLTAGVPMICWPFFAEQQTNCLYSCTDWGVGMEIDNNVKREEVEGMIREMMAGEKGRAMRAKAAEWKESAAKAISPLGSSSVNLEKVIEEVLRSNSS